MSNDSESTDTCLHANRHVGYDNCRCIVDANPHCPDVQRVAGREVTEAQRRFDYYCVCKHIIIIDILKKKVFYLM